MISNLRLQNFRSYKDASFEFEDGVNIIVGPNASGKTNLLEAISYLCKGKSFKSIDEEVILFGEKWARIDGFANSGDRTVKFMCGDNVKKDFNIDGVNHKRLTLQKSIPIVIFEPSHMQLIQGSPEKRRNYIDNLIEQTTIGFSKIRRDYQKTLSQRNQLLKNNINDLKQQFVWNIQLSELGGKIAKERLTLLGQINNSLSLIYSGIANKEHKIELEYMSKSDIENYSSSFLKNLENNYSEDQKRGFTGHGPHRDDIQISINDQSILKAASRGEIRTTLLSLKIYELEAVEEFRQEIPILLLDDVFSELDGLRRKALTKYLKNRQTFITTTDADIVGNNLQISRIIAVNN
ncbi:DNA replication and repair protein RecF [Candidatus Saccharibacteria bacterium]|nr:DNA replication and repair protein RecF [Candidatus Saccharibacteria bacterium]